MNINIKNCDISKDRFEVDAVYNLNYDLSLVVDIDLYVDGFTLLLTNQSEKLENGIYVYVKDTGFFTRSDFFDVGQSLEINSYVHVKSSDDIYVISSYTDLSTLIIGVDPIYFIKGNSVGVDVDGWSLDGIGENEIQVFTDPNIAEWTFDGPGQTSLILYGLPTNSQWRLLDSYEDIGESNTLTINNSDGWQLFELDEKTSLEVIFNIEDGRWRLIDVLEIDEEFTSDADLLSIPGNALKINTIPEHSEWIFYEKCYQTLTVNTLSEDNKWFLDDIDKSKSNELLNWGILNIDFKKNKLLHQKISRDYRYIKDRFLIKKFLDIDLNNLYEYVFLFNNVDEYLPLSLILFKNKDIFLEDFYDTMKELCDNETDYMLYKLSHNQRLFLRLSKYPSTLGTYSDDWDINRILDGNISSTDEVSSMGSVDYLYHSPQPEIDASEVLEDIYMFKYELPEDNYFHNVIHIVHVSGVFKFEIIDPLIRDNSYLSNRNVFYNKIFVANNISINEKDDNLPSGFYIDTTNILNTTEYSIISDENYEIISFNSLSSNLIHKSNFILTGLSNSGYRYNLTGRKDDVHSYEMLPGLYTLVLNDSVSKSIYTIKYKLNEKTNINVHLRNINTKEYVDISNMNLILYKDQSKWFYKITDKIKMITIDNIEFLEEYQVLYVNCLNRPFVYSLSMFMYKESFNYSPNFKSIIVFHNIFNSDNIVYGIQYIHGYYSIINHETIFNYKIELLSENIDFYNDFLYKENDIDVFNYYYKILYRVKNEIYNGIAIGD